LAQVNPGLAVAGAAALQLEKRGRVDQIAELGVAPAHDGGLRLAGLMKSER